VVKTAAINTCTSSFNFIHNWEARMGLKQYVQLQCTISTGIQTHNDSQKITEMLISLELLDLPVQQITLGTYSSVNKPHSVNKYLCEYEMQKKI
jgi:hypothetical protein